MSTGKFSPTLVVICGLPGSGKTTPARRLEQEMSALQFCPDEWMQALEIDLYDEDRRDRVEQIQWMQAKWLLSLEQSVLIEWGTWGRSERDRLREEGRALGVRVELHYLTAPLDVLLNRIQRRGMENPPITGDEIEGWARCMQPPSEEEMSLFDRALILG
ncbi:AAA family ATPase [Parathermosynechococcus lividus]